MKNKLLKTLLASGTGVVGLASLTALPLTSCSNNNETFRVSLIGQDVTIDKTKAVAGKDFKATISSSTEIITIRTILVDGVNVPFNYYSFEISEDKMSCSLNISKYVVEGSITIYAVTRFDPECYYINIIDDIDNAGLYSEDPWITQKDIDDGFQIDFSTDYPIATWYPDAAGTPQVNIEISCGDHIIPYGDWSFSTDENFHYTITFANATEINNDITIKVRRLSYIYGTGKYAGDMTYFNYNCTDMEGITTNNVIRGTKAQIQAVYYGDARPENVKFNDFNVYINHYKIPKDCYTWDESIQYNLKIAVITIDSDVVLGDISINADLTILG